MTIPTMTTPDLNNFKNIYGTINEVLDRNRHRKMVFYGRVSTEHEAQLSALQNQMQWYDDQLKYHQNWEVIDRYIDEGITGTQAKKRPSFLRMIEDAKNGKFDLIVTREVCRFARNVVDTLVYTRELKYKYGVEVYFVEDNIWTMDGDGELRLAIMATLAQEESRKTSERVKAGQKISRDNGVLYGNGNILGYDRIGETYVINEEQAETVRMIYNMYLDGLGEMKISKELVRLKRKNAQGNVKWSASKINRILKRPTYKGVLAYGQSFSNNYLEQKRINNLDANTYQYTNIDIPVIIPPEDWEKVQEIRQSKTLPMNENRTRGYGKKKANDIWLRKLKCKCGSSFRKNKWRTNSGTGEDCFGYQCYNQLNNGSKSYREKNGLDTEGYCDIKMIADWKLDLMAKEVISNIWQQRSESVITAYQMIIDCYKNEPSMAQKQIKEIQMKIQKSKDKLANLIEMRADGEISKNEYGTMRTKIDSQIESLQAELDSLKEDNETKENMEQKLETIKRVLSETIDFSKPKLEEYIIERFVRQVTPIDNNLFKWYIKLTDDNSDLQPDEITIGVSGRKGKAMIINENGDVRLPSNYYNTGCYSCKQGEELIYRFTIPFEKAREYRKSYGRYLRCNQWNNIDIEIYIF